MHDHQHKQIPENELDLSEKGFGEDGRQISMDRRLYMQFHAYTGATDIDLLIRSLETNHISGTLYLDIGDPQGIGLITMNENPSFFVEELRTLLTQDPWSHLTHKPHFTMTGRTYAIGYEQNLEETLFSRPTARILDPKLEWAIWYPLRRSGAFERLSTEEQRTILKEHGGIGHKFGKAQLAYDIRLDCHGLNQHDNDFMIGIVGPELTPLSKVVEHMRKTRQTSEFIDHLGPFFVGKVCWQSKK